LTKEIVTTAMVLVFPHADPALRFLAGTAKVLDLTLVTNDRNLLDSTEISTLSNR
jgi:PIN domain nuclease of toxin-antitoxin system